MGEQIQRDYRYELIRIIAVFCVIGVHELYLYPLDGTLLREVNYTLLSILFPCCNALFFMMSGHFALTKKVDDAHLGEFYFKKFVYLLIPLFVYSVIYAVGRLWVDTQSLEGLGTHLLASFSELNNQTHLWYMYVLVGHILVSPFTSRILDSLSRKGALIFILLGLGYNLLCSYAPYFTGHSFAWIYPFGGWSLYFYIGGCYDKIMTTERSENCLKIVGIVSLLIILSKCFFFEYKENMCDLMPSFTFFSLMLYMLLQKIRISNDKGKKVILFLGKRSYSMYLMLYVVVYILTSFLPETHTMPDILFLILVMISTFVGCFVASYLMDLYVIQMIQKVFMMKTTPRE